MNVQNDLVKITEFFDGKRVVIFSPAAPFSHRIFYKIRDLNLKDTKYFFTDLNTSHKTKKEDYTIESLIDFFTGLIDRIDIDKDIYLVGFGIFAILFSKLLTLNKDRVKGLFFIEPDFSNSLLAKIFDADDRPFFKYEYLIKFYSEGASREKGKNVLKKDLKSLRTYFYDNKKYLESNKILKELTDYKNRIKIFWKVMANVSWPLPQILVEEYDFQTFLLEKDVLESLSLSKGTLFDEIKKSINL